MTKFYFIALLMLAVMSCNQAPQTTVKVHVEGGQANVKPKLVTKDSTYVMALDSTNSVVFTMAENIQPGYANVQYGRINIPVYIEPGKSFEATIKIEGRQVTPAFTGEGAKKNEYLNSEAFRSFYPDFKLDEAAFIAALDARLKKCNENLDTLGFDPLFNQQEKKRLNYSVYGMLAYYPSYHPYYAQPQEKDYTPSEAYYNKFAAAVVEDESLMNMPEYQAALEGLVETMASKDMIAYNTLQYTKNQLNFVEQNFKSPVTADFLVDKIVSAYVGRYGVDNLAEFESVYNAKVTSPKKKAEFKKLCDKWGKIAQGQPSPTFKYLDIDGKEVSLSDLAGKYVYIDNWATWCGPCRGELPALKELEHKYKNKNIYFVSISCDQDKAAWEKMVKEDKLGGIQLHNGGDNTFMDAYMVTGIPRFILLDREGKIINANMSRPSNPETVKVFDALEGI